MLEIMLIVGGTLIFFGVAALAVRAVMRNDTSPVDPTAIAAAAILINKL